MTASKASSSSPKFPKALVAAGLAAVLVGCGGGGSETARTRTEPTPAEMAQMAAIKAANDRLETAKTALSGLPATATDQEKRTAQQAVHDAADNLVTVLRANNGTADQIQSATKYRADALTHVNRLTASIDSTALMAAVAGLSGTSPTAAQVKAVEDAVAKLEASVAKLPSTARQGYQAQIASAKQSITTANGHIADAERKMEDMKKEDAKRVFAAIGVTPFADRTTAYSESDIHVTIGTAEPVPLKLDKTASVGALHGWEGQKFTGKKDDITYEAHVYSHIGEPTPGKEFNKQYTLTNGVLNETGIVGTGDAGFKLIAIPSANTAGRTTFGKAGEETMISGSYHGVQGTYSCTPGSGKLCAVAFLGEGEGFSFGEVDANDDGDPGIDYTAKAGTWTFDPKDSDARITSVPDSNYASYGWWIRKDGNTWTVGAFHDYRGTDTAPVGLDNANLKGTFTYSGGAAGKYSFYNPSGTNDAGHFTAKATLKANFGDEGKISGTIDTFKDGDGNAKNWSVDLESSAFTAVGVISGNGNPAVPAKTTWTVDGNKSPSGGHWTGNFREGGSGANALAPEIVTGQFFSEYPGARMVGAFGAKKE